MQTVLKLVLGYVMDYVKDLIVEYFKKEKKKQVTAKDIRNKKETVKQNLDAAYDGKPITKQQQKELIDAYRDLIRNYHKSSGV